MSYGFKDVIDFKVGDVFYESDYCGTVKLQVSTLPSVEEVDIFDEKHRQVSFKATMIEGGKEVEFLMTEGLEHYGPKLYDHPAYVNLKEI